MGNVMSVDLSFQQQETLIEITDTQLIRKIFGTILQLSEEKQW